MPLHNPDGIMLMYADSEHRRSRWHYGSRAIMAPGGRWGSDQQESVAGLSGHSLLTAFPLLGGEGAKRPGGDNSAEGLPLHCTDLLILIPLNLVAILRIRTGEAGARNGRESLAVAHSAEGRVSQWSCHK